VAVDDHESVFRHSVQELGQVRHVRKIPRFVHDKDGEVETSHIERIREVGCPGSLLTKHRYLMTEFSAYLDILCDGINATGKSIELGNQKDLHERTPSFSISTPIRRTKA